MNISCLVFELIDSKGLFKQGGRGSGEVREKRIEGSGGVVPRCDITHCNQIISYYKKKTTVRLLQPIPLEPLLLPWNSCSP